MTKLRLVTFNCNGLKSSILEIQQLCKNHDVIFIQELWLFKYELSMLSNISSEFEGIGLSAMDESYSIIQGRPYGGVGILIRKSIRSCINFMFYDNSRILGCEVISCNVKHLFINVYMPYQTEDNYNNYVEQLCILESIIQDADTNSIAIIGDINANITSLFGNEITDFCDRLDLIVSDVKILSRDTFTHVSDAHGTTSWLDHGICSNYMHNLINNVCILDKSPSSDHLPVSFIFNIVFSDYTPFNNCSVVDKKIVKWLNADGQSLHNYKELTKLCFSNYSLPSALKCTDCTCDSYLHKQEIATFYDNLCKDLFDISCKSIPLSNQTCKSYVIPGFNDYVKEFHTAARNAYVVWRAAGKPRDGQTRDDMNATRLRFKYALRQCKLIDETARADSMARSLQCNNHVEFWKEV